MEDTKPRNGRSSLVASREICLSKSDPLERLQEFCNQGKYKYKISWDKFKNGFMCQCRIHYRLKKNTQILKKEAFWVQTEDLNVAKKTIAAIILDGLGLGVPEPETEDLTDQILKAGVKTLSGLVGKSWAEMVDENDD